MATFKEILDSLDSDKRKLLFYAFENEMCQYVEYGESKFIGVNIKNQSHLKPTETVGVWSMGDVTKPS